MRTVGGQALAESDWQVLLATELDNDTDSAAKPVTTGWCHTCYVWSVVSMAAFVGARESARTAQKTLFYTQAADMCLNPVARGRTETEKLYHDQLNKDEEASSILSSACWHGSTFDDYARDAVRGARCNRHSGGYPV